MNEAGTLIAEACAGELALLDPAVRRSREAVAWLLHPEFAERGQSGRWWTREDTIEVLPAEQLPDRAEAVDLIGTELAAGIVLVTYVSVRGGTRTGRSSVWMQHEGRMQIRWHQGTPLPQ